ncbi:hypothetical protein O9G_004720 [Rozella allomycis CSF55]|uniref:Uncharacterized protein n=1 Tax=Rozella allomycis (strain CSF55) TaxID=988480 RepID=A0A075B0W0_ROZAC|nr:hypothetical protein O9G_004720 [Rozella allomycis CSF55]|eukprot:EPZ34466.1 hypothetical protein O9G_004720 [Rozella allomycis CSF55]
MMRVKTSWIGIQRKRHATRRFQAGPNYYVPLTWQRAPIPRIHPKEKYFETKKVDLPFLTKIME